MWTVDCGTEGLEIEGELKHFYCFFIGKSSVVTRRYPMAQLLLREALLKAHEIYGKDHLKYADCLQDYAFYLLNVDKVGLSVQAYEEALQIRTDILGSHNLLVAKLYEELAYATYVFEYR